jgi:hypothetical protein
MEAKTLPLPVGAALGVRAFVLAATAGGFRVGLLLLIAVSAGAFACVRPILPIAWITRSILMRGETREQAAPRLCHNFKLGHNSPFRFSCRSGVVCFHQ